jgi:DNA-binding HxlR family transcriptional regulator
MEEKSFAEIRKNCPVYKTLQLMGKKWALDIISELICQGDKRRYNELQRALVFISPKVLSERLKELEAEGIIKRCVYPEEIPVRVEYELTEKGKNFEEAIDCLRRWGNKWAYSGTHKDYCKLCNDYRAGERSV